MSRDIGAMDVLYYLDTVCLVGIPMKATQWCMKPKMTDFPGLKNPGSEAVLPLCFFFCV